MVNSVEFGRSMGVSYGKAALEEGLSSAEHESRLMINVFDGPFKCEVIESFDKHQNGELLTTREVAFIAEVNSMVAFLHALQYKDELSCEIPNRGQLNFAPMLYRLKNFYRLVDFLMLTGVLKQDVFNSNKLVLGAGPVVPDVYPLSYEFKIQDIRELLETDFQIQVPADTTRLVNQLVDRGIIQIGRKQGKIIVVDNDEFILMRGVEWAKSMGIEVEHHAENARVYLSSQKRVLKESNIGLVMAARLDPLMAGGNFSFPNEFQRKTREFTTNIADIVASAKINDDMDRASRGQVFITIGSGKSYVGESSDYREWKEYKERKRTTGIMKGKLGRLGLLLHQDLERIPACQPWLLPQVSDLNILVANSGLRRIK